MYHQRNILCLTGFLRVYHERDHSSVHLSCTHDGERGAQFLSFSAQVAKWSRWISWGGVLLVIDGTRLPRWSASSACFRTRWSRLMSAGRTPARTGNMAMGVGAMAPDIMHRASFSTVFILIVCRLCDQTGAAYSAVA